MADIWRDIPVARWRQPEIQANFLEDLPNTDGFKDALTIAANTVDSAAAIARVIDALLVEPDPLSAILLLAGNQLQQFLVSLRETDVYALPLMPQSWRSLLRPYTIEKALNDFTSSTGDMLDGSRPQGFGPDDAWASFTLAVGANNWHDFEEALRIFGSLFGEGDKWWKLFTMSANWRKGRESPLERKYRNSQGTPWDWHRTNWMDHVPIIGRGLDALINALNDLIPYSRGLASGIAELAQLLRDRIIKIEKALEEVEKIARLIAEWQELLPRLHYLPAASPVGGVTGYVSTVTNALNRPEFKLMAGVTFVSFGPNAVAYVDRVGTLIGLRMDEIQSGYDQAAARIEQNQRRNP